MNTPFAKAAKRAGAFMPLPMTVDLPGDELNVSRYWRTSGPISETDPAKDKPNPSSMDLRPSSKTFRGMSSYFVLTMKSATYLVRPGALGNSELACCAKLGSSLALIKAAVLAKKCRRFIQVP